MEESDKAGEDGLGGGEEFGRPDMVLVILGEDGAGEEGGKALGRLSGITL